MALSGSHQDSTACLSSLIYLALLVGLPSRLTFAPLGGAGSPAVLVGFSPLRGGRTSRCGAACRRVPGHNRFVPRSSWFAAVCVSYIGAMTRAIDAEESSTAQLGLVILASWGGILLVANDGIPSRERFEVIVRRVVFACACLGALGIVQFLTGKTWVEKIWIPGLSVDQAIGAFTSRGGFNRPPGTALHAIE